MIAIWFIFIITLHSQVDIRYLWMKMLLSCTITSEQSLKDIYLRWPTTVLMDYNSPTSNSFKIMFQDVFPFSIYCLLKSFTILCETWTIKHKQMAKMNDQVPKERLGTSRLNHDFSQNLLVWPHLRISGIRNWFWFKIHAN